MTPALLSQVGAALYGPRWQAELARALGVSDRSLRRWLSGDNPIPAGVWGDCSVLLIDRQREIADLLLTGRKDNDTI